MSMKLTGQQIQRIHNALLAGYSPDSLRMMVRMYLEKNLHNIAGGTTFCEQVFMLIEWAERQGRVLELVRAAQQANPGNDALQTLVRDVQVWFTAQSVTESTLLARNQIVQLIVEAIDSMDSVSSEFATRLVPTNDSLASAYTHIQSCLQNIFGISQLLGSKSGKNYSSDTIMVVNAVIGDNQNGLIKMINDVATSLLESTRTPHDRNQSANIQNVRSGVLTIKSNLMQIRDLVQ